MYPPLHDNNLDRLSRDAADQFEVEPGASGWDHLERRLDQELPQKKDRRRFLFWLFFIALIAGGALTAVLHYMAPTNELPQKAVAATPSLNSEAPPGIAEANNAPDHPIGKGNKADANNQLPITDKTEEHSTPAQQRSSLQQPDKVAGTAIVPGTTTTPVPANSSIVTKGKKATVPVAPPGLSSHHPLTQAEMLGPDNIVKKHSSITNKKRNNAGLSNEAGNTASTQKKSNNKAVITNDNNTVVPANNTAAAAVAATGSGSTNEPATTAPVASKPAATAAPDNSIAPAVVVATDSVKIKEDKTASPAIQHWELGVTAGPDASNVSFNHMYKTGYNFGVQVGYRISNRWQINTGVIYTKKFYKADREYYNPKDYTPPANLAYVAGNCKMWEIPINVRYDFIYNNKRRWFISTGLSTYLMTEEYYRLYYTNNYSYPKNNDTGSQYPFSIMNISLGMERSLGKHFSLTAEPYFKLPLKGLGMGNMLINSYGMYFTLKYKPTFRRKTGKQ